jgi:DNA-binding GntR family transcriptional regulator
LEEHWKIIEALAADDVETLAALCVAHIQRPKDYYLRANRLAGQELASVELRVE